MDHLLSRELSSRDAKAFYGTNPEGRFLIEFARSEFKFGRGSVSVTFLSVEGSIQPPVFPGFLVAGFTLYRTVQS